MTSEDVSVIADGYRHQRVEVCDSTNLLVLDAARAGDRGDLWISAATQTRGKGSRGRSWTSEPGNLYASLLLREPCKPEHLPELTFVAALAVHQVLCDVLPETTVSLKWPNDVLVNSKKISGILLESRIAGSETCVAVGIGINCHSHPDETIFPATNLLAEGVDLTPQELLDILAGVMADMLRHWSRGKGFAFIRAEWLNHAWGLGRDLVITLFDGSEKSGRYCGLTSQGYLQLETADKGMEVISVGDIFPLEK